jgi:hypothetical protein
MNDVEKEVDIMSEIKDLNLKFGRDLVYIVGSTTVEFWFKNENAKRKVTNLLRTLKYGKIINKKEFRILTTSDAIFLANFKTAFYPNFFSRKHYKAMHGWNPKEQRTYYILKGAKGKKNAKMVDFLPTITKLMKLPRPECNGKSLI